MAIITPIAARVDRGREVAKVGNTELVLNLGSLRRGRSLSEVATLVGIRPEELSRIESGKTRQIRWETLLRILRAYDCGIDDLLEVRSSVESEEESPRETYLAALRNRKRNVPGKRLVIREEGTGLDTAAVAALSEPVDRGIPRRTFIPASKRIEKSLG